MITDEQLGLKIAEDPEEALWVRQIEIREEDIKNLENNLIIARAFLETAKTKLEKYKKA